MDNFYLVSGIIIDPYIGGSNKFRDVIDYPLFNEKEIIKYEKGFGIKNNLKKNKYEVYVLNVVKLPQKDKE